ncbi:MAG TPA: sugar phosphate isomerase/epimerase family protein [Terriglobales bacterium]|jgi:sugar phosphate isomerase/epimerase|nr:sugar phosphate isomerase/epimerase family protein [Terriglobales bacterium]
MKTRRKFLSDSAALAAGAVLFPALANASSSQPNVTFPAAVRDRLAVASYPFRDFILPTENVTPTAKNTPKMEITEFAAHVIERFQINKIEPWSHHFRSLEPKYLADFRRALDRAKASVVDIAVDGEHSFYAPDPAERERAVVVNKQWIDAAIVLGSPSIRTHIAGPDNQPPDPERCADTLKRIAEYGATRNVVVHLENDDGITEDPFFIAKLIDKVNSPWLRGLPDFGNSLMHLPPENAYTGLEEMFQRAYGISHIKGSESTDKGAVVSVDMAYAFGILKKSGYRGYLSMEYDDAGDPYAGTKQLIETTLRLLT